MQEYKGIYYGEEKEQKFYEGGAHFKYESLYRILEFLASQQSTSSRRHFNNSSSNKKQQISIKIHKDSSNSKKSRNILNFSYFNKSIFETQIKKRNDSSNSKNNQKRKFLDSNMKSNSTYTKKKSIPKKNVISRNVDSITLKGKPNTMLTKKNKNDIIRRKNGKSSSSLENRSINKSINRSKNKHINKSHNKSINSNYKKSFPNLKNAFNNNNKSDLTDRKYSKKIKVDMRRLHNLLRQNYFSSFDEDDNNNLSNINNIKIKSGNKTNRLNDNKIKFRNSNYLDNSINDNSVLITNNNKIKITEKNNLTQKPKIKVKHIIKDKTITKSNNMPSSMQLFNIRFRNKQKLLYNTTNNAQKKNKQSIDITNNKYKINEISKPTIISTKNVIENYKQKTNTKISLTNNKLCKLNNNMRISKDLSNSNNRSKQLIKIRQIGVNDKNCITSRDNILLHRSNNSSKIINIQNKINYSSEKKKFFKNNIKKHEKFSGDKKLNRGINTMNYKELVTRRIIKKPKKKFK